MSNSCLGSRPGMVVHSTHVCDAPFIFPIRSVACTIAHLVPSRAFTTSPIINHDRHGHPLPATHTTRNAGCADKIPIPPRRSHQRRKRPVGAQGWHGQLVEICETRCPSPRVRHERLLLIYWPTYYNLGCWWLNRVHIGSKYMIHHENKMFGNCTSFHHSWTSTSRFFRTKSEPTTRFQTS